MLRVICAVLAAFVFSRAAQSKDNLQPPKLYVSKGACPFECCTYRKWIAKQTLGLLDRPGGAAVARIQKGEEVLGITGEVWSHPLRFRIERRAPSLPAEPDLVGATVYLLHPIGEGFWLVWYRGKVLETDPEYGGSPRYVWWAKVRLRSGRIGWVRMDVPNMPFDNVDACG
ncbi:MAG TPA: hypothetical protein VHU83_23060 [Bryobacteraceae bacterium]|jgi:hypothetical protein|nr:hypothetical protein [Bryobacteraceae bacterium]